MPRIATMGVRLAARLLDTVLVLVALMPLRLLTGWLGLYQGPHYDLASGQVVEGGSTLLRTAFTAVAVAAVVSYEVVLTATRGATLGKRALGLRVVRRLDGSLPSWERAAVRWLLPTAGLLACFVGVLVVYASPLLDGTGFNRGWHDRAAGTVVIRE